MVPVAAAIAKATLPLRSCCEMKVASTARTAQSTIGFTSARCLATSHPTVDASVLKWRRRRWWRAGAGGMPFHLWRIGTPQSACIRQWCNSLIHLHAATIVWCRCISVVCDAYVELRRACGRARRRRGCRHCVKAPTRTAGLLWGFKKCQGGKNHFAHKRSRARFWNPAWIFIDKHGERAFAWRPDAACMQRDGAAPRLRASSSRSPSP